MQDSVSGLNRVVFFYLYSQQRETMPVSLKKPVLEVEVGALVPGTASQALSYPEPPQRYLLFHKFSSTWFQV